MKTNEKMQNTASKKMMRFTVCNCSILLIFCLLQIVFNNIIPAIRENSYTYVIPNDVFEYVMGYTSEDYINNEEYLPHTYIPYDKAQVDENDNVVLTISEGQRIAWMESCKRRLLTATNIGYQISKDLTSVSISISDIMTTFYSIDPMSLVFVTKAAIIMQMLEGVPPESLELQLTVTGNSEDDIIYSATWPDEELSFSLDITNFF